MRETKIGQAGRTGIGTEPSEEYLKESEMFVLECLEIFEQLQVRQAQKLRERFITNGFINK